MTDLAGTDTANPASEDAAIARTDDSRWEEGRALAPFPKAPTRPEADSDDGGRGEPMARPLTDYLTPETDYLTPDDALDSPDLDAEPEEDALDDGTPAGGHDGDFDPGGE